MAQNQNIQKRAIQYEQNGLSIKSIHNEGSIRLVNRETNAQDFIVNINEAKKPEPIPSGTIIMFKGDIIPEGWHFCDGNNGTPDLRGRFILGGSAAGKTGGQAESFIPEHNHGGSVTTNTFPNHKHWVDFPNVVSSSAGNHTHRVYTTGINDLYFNSFDFPEQYYGYYSDRYQMPYTGNHTHTLTIPRLVSSRVRDHAHTMTITEAGNDNPEGNLPPYYTLAFIMKK